MRLVITYRGSKVPEVHNLDHIYLRRDILEKAIWKYDDYIDVLNNI